MKFLEEPALTMINSVLNECEIGDRIINGSIEAFSCKRASADKKLARNLENQYQQEISNTSCSNSPIGSLTEAPTRKLLINLISTMNASFPDYDFSTLRPEQFGKELHLKLIRNAINTQLSEMVEIHSNGLLEQLWRAIDLVIQPEQCEIYSYIPDLESDPFSESTTLWSFNYFFYNRQLKKILYFKCLSRTKIYDDASVVATDERVSEDESEDYDHALMDWEDGV